MDINTPLIDRYDRANFFGRLLGIHYEIIAPGEVHYFMAIGQMHLATPAAAHGGAISALVDAALGVAGLSAVHQEGKVVSTVEYKVNFLAPAQLGDQLVAKAKVEQKGKRLLIITCDVVCANRQNKSIAKAMGTFNAYDSAKAGY